MIQYNSETDDWYVHYMIKWNFTPHTKLNIATDFEIKALS